MRAKERGFSMDEGYFQLYYRIRSCILKRTVLHLYVSFKSASGSRDVAALLARACCNIVGSSWSKWTDFIDYAVVEHHLLFVRSMIHEEGYQKYYAKKMVKYEAKLARIKCRFSAEEQVLL